MGSANFQICSDQVSLSSTFQQNVVDASDSVDLKNIARATKACANSTNLSVLKKDEDGYLSRCSIYEELKKVVVLEKENASMSNYIKELETVLENKEKEIISQKNQIKELKDKNKKLSDDVEERNNAPDPKPDQKSKMEETKCELAPLSTPCFIKQENPSLAFATQSARVVIQKRVAGAIIGPFGSRIQAIRSESKASIVIEDEVIGSDTRFVTIVGTMQQIQSAKFLLQQAIRQHIGRCHVLK